MGAILHLLARSGAKLQPDQVFRRRLLGWIGCARRGRHSWIEDGRIGPLLDLGVAVGKRDSARPVVVSRRNIDPRGGKTELIADKKPIVDRPRTFIEEQPGICGPRSGNVSLFSINE